MGIISELTDYSNAIIDGRIVACKKHKWACLRFLNDLDARGREGWPWDFDEERAERYFRWMRLFKHSKIVRERILTLTAAAVIIFIMRVGYRAAKTYYLVIKD